MKSLLIIAHGSRRQASNEEVIALAERVRHNGALAFDDVSAAFLELAEPSIPDALERCIQRGAKEVVVFPYFLAAGRHVVTDIPEEIAPVVAQHPEVAVSVAPHLGASGMLADLIVSAANRG